MEKRLNFPNDTSVGRLHQLGIWGEENFLTSAPRIVEAQGTIVVKENELLKLEINKEGNWQAAAEAWNEIGCPYEEAMALADGDEPAKLAALEILERLGAGPLKEMLSQALRATGVRSIRRGPRPSTKENPYGLTNRELEVLTLMAQGLGNAQISQRLFISARTVEHHVAAVFAKLEVHSRSEAIAFAFQSGLVDQNR